jgi:hypothetical protein
MVGGSVTLVRYELCVCEHTQAQAYSQKEKLGWG